MLYWYPYEGPLMPIYGAIFKALTEKGYSITIISSFPHYRIGRSETWEEFRGKLYEVVDWEGVRLIRTYVFAPVFKNKKLGIFFRALNYISFNITSVIFALLKGGRPDLVFAPSSPPLTNGIIASIVGAINRCPVVYNVQDLYPDMAVKMDLIKDKFSYRFLIALEKKVYKYSDIVLTISEKMAHIIQRKGAAHTKIKTIRNFIDTNFIKPCSKKNPFSIQNDIAESFVIMYAGNIGIPHGVEVLIKAAEILTNESIIKFCFVARGEYKDKVEAEAKRLGLLNTVFINPQIEEMVPFIWASASVCVLTYKRGLAEFSVPSKLIAMMCAARPVIAAVDKDSETARIISESGCGMVVNPDNEREIANAILKFKKEPELLEKKGSAGRDYVEKFMDKETIVKKYQALFQSLIVNK